MPPERLPFTDTASTAVGTRTGDGHHPRHLADRRRRPTGPCDAFRLRGRRARPRRVEERKEGYFTDQFDPVTFVMALMLLVMTVIDGTLTLLLLGIGCEEINPAMRYLLTQSPMHFIIGKYALTATGLPFLLIYRNFTLFGTPFRVGYLIPIFVGLYLVLLSYQVWLIVG